MLASLLPGLRDLRTPLTVGYLWFLFSWILFGDQIHPWAADLAIADEIKDLRGVAGAGLTFGTVAFAAYLLGSVLVIDTNRGYTAKLIDWIESKWPRGASRNEYAEHLAGIRREYEAEVKRTRLREVAGRSDDLDAEFGRVLAPRLPI